MVVAGTTAQMRRHSVTVSRKSYQYFLGRLCQVDKHGGIHNVTPSVALLSLHPTLWFHACLAWLLAHTALLVIASTIVLLMPPLFIRLVADMWRTE
jgi:hypothetical protein